MYPECLPQPQSVQVDDDGDLVYMPPGCDAAARQRDSHDELIVVDVDFLQQVGRKLLLQAGSVSGTQQHPQHWPSLQKVTKPHNALDDVRPSSDSCTVTGCWCARAAFMPHHDINAMQAMGVELHEAPLLRLAQHTLAEQGINLHLLAPFTLL